MFPKGAPDSEIALLGYASLLDVADIVCLRHQPAELFRNLIPRLRATVPCDSINFALYDPLRKTMKHYPWNEGEPWPSAPHELPLEDSAAGWVWRNQQALVIDDVRLEKRFAPGLRWLSTRGLRSYCVLPLTTSYQRLGALGVASAQTQAYRRHEERFLFRVAEMVALSVDNTQAQSTLLEEEGRIRLLLDIGHAWSRLPSLEPAALPEHIALFLDPLQRWAGQSYVGLYLYEEESSSLRLYTHAPKLARQWAAAGTAPLEGSVAGRTFREQEPQVLGYADLSQLSFPSVKRGLEMGVKSLCMIPILSPDGPLGVLKVASRVERAFTARDIEVLTQVATAAVPVLQDALSLRSQKLSQSEDFLLVSNAPNGGLIAGPASRTLGSGGRTALPQREPGKLIPFASAEALSEPEQLLEAYFSSSTVGLCILDTELRYIAINHTLAEMNGLPAAAHLGKTIREMLGDVASQLEPEFKRVLATGQPVFNLDVSAALPGREEFGHWVEHFFPIKDASGRIKQIGVVVVEITEQKNLEESLRRLTANLQQEKRRLQVLVEISELLGRSTDIPRIFPQVSASIRRVLRHECAFVSLYDEKNNMFVRQAQDFPFGKGLLAAASSITSGGPQEKAVAERRPLIFSRDAVEAFRSETGLTELANGFLAEGLKSMCCVPMLRPSGPMGTLILASTRPDAFRAEDSTLLNQIAAQLAIALENARVAQEVDELNSRLAEEKKYLEGELRTEVMFEGIIGESPALRQVLDQVSTVAGSDATALILGETGTGKELIARAIHRMSRRKERGFVKLNCAAIPTGLLESELFGHEKGAFTGAITQKIGRLELADQGTLFLDEVGEIPLELQPKLLRVLQDHEFERLGGIRTIKVNLRLVAATNRELSKSVSAGDFRSDLFYRLNVFPIRVPPLRERRDDIPALVRYFVHRYAHQMDRRIESVPTETMKALIDWHWPGNVRELENLIERSVILSEGPNLRVPISELILEGQISGSSDTLENAEREHILRVLRETGGIISGPEGAAHKLGLKRTTLQSKMQRLRITREDYSKLKPGW